MERTKETVKGFLKAVAASDGTNPLYQAAIQRALLFMYSRQTATEQESKMTSNNNGMGFNGHDAEFMSSVAQKAQQYNRISPKQTTCIAKGLVKYSGQLLEMPSEGSQTQAKPVVEQYLAG